MEAVDVSVTKDSVTGDRWFAERDLSLDISLPLIGQILAEWELLVDADRLSEQNTRELQSRETIIRRNFPAEVAGDIGAEWSRWPGRHFGEADLTQMLRR
jgi:hypothetical protein